MTRKATSMALSHEDVRNIRAKLAIPCPGCGRPHSAASLAPTYGVSRVALWKVAKGISYQNLKAETE